jgi:hypothetical protein
MHGHLGYFNFPVACNPGPSVPSAIKPATLENNLSKILQRVFTLLIAMSLVACATTEKIALNADAKRTIKRVALVDIPEPDRYFMNPGQSAGTPVLFIFGAIGGAIAGGIEAQRFESATTRFTAAVIPLKPNTNSLFVTNLEQGLKQKGYEVTRVPPPPKTADGKQYDIAKINGEFDAVLVANLTSGYAVVSGAAGPRSFASVSLLSNANSSKLFADSYIYSASPFGKNVQVAPDKKFVIASVDAMYADITVAAEGMKEGANKLAERILQEF